MAYNTVYTQRNATRNQSTMDYRTNVVFIDRGAEFLSDTFVNNTGGDLDVSQGILVRRDVTNNKLFPVTSATMADTIGVLNVKGVTTLADDGEMSVTYGIKGIVDSGLLILPDTVTLDTTVGTKNVTDILTGIGIIPKAITELTTYTE